MIVDVNELIREHERLIKTLKSGDKKKLEREIKIQSRELKDYKAKRMDYCPRCRKRKEHLKHMGIKMCKTCGYQEKC